mmetsp:Transcript_19753/g.54875  ORF Transcript_19753/g.54875 Transcript_19753/m.54875 type:complete len:205 (-) Transcript_19753:1714-2328(-)
MALSFLATELAMSAVKASIESACESTASFSAFSPMSVWERLDSKSSRLAFICTLASARSFLEALLSIKALSSASCDCIAARVCSLSVAASAANSSSLMESFASSDPTSSLLASKASFTEMSSLLSPFPRRALWTFLASSWCSSCKAFALSRRAAASLLYLSSSSLRIAWFSFSEAFDLCSRAWATAMRSVADPLLPSASLTDLL